MGSEIAIRTQDAGVETNTDETDGKAEHSSQEPSHDTEGQQDAHEHQSPLVNFAFSN